MSIIVNNNYISKTNGKDIIFQGMLWLMATLTTKYCFTLMNLIQVKVLHVNVTNRCDLYGIDRHHRLHKYGMWNDLSIQFMRQNQYYIAKQTQCKLISYFITHKSVCDLCSIIRFCVVMSLCLFSSLVTKLIW